MRLERQEMNSVVLKGSLATKDYKHFEIHDDDGQVVHQVEGASKANLCLPGDSVEWREDSGLHLLERGADSQTIILSGYLELNSKTIYGMTNRNVPLYLFVPLNPSYPCFIVGSKSPDRSHKQVATIQFLEWKDTTFPRGSLVQILGPAGDLKAEEDAVLIQACPWKSLTKGLTVLKDTAPKRVVITEEGFTFNIDPLGCRDVDDVVTIQRLAKTGHTQIYITISDVASCIEELSAVDIMASTQGCTLYKEGVAVRPMLPPFFSEEHCSLISDGTYRRGVSLGFVWNAEENRILESSVKWLETDVRTDSTYTYENVTSKNPEAAALLRSITSVLDPTENSSDPHTWIAALMKYYNLAAGALLKQIGVGILRRHSAPDLERLAKYAAYGVGQLAQSSAEYCLASETDTLHSGLGAAAYCHATSPLRRYADLMNQRILKQLIRGQPEGLMVTVFCSDLNNRMKIARGYERDITFLRCLLGAEGTREFSALILDASVLAEEALLTLRIWIPEWRRAIKMTSTLVSKIENIYTILSADETTAFKVAEGQELRIRCGLNLGGRRWKDRMVIQPLSSSAPRTPE